MSNTLTAVADVIAAEIDITVEEVIAAESLTDLGIDSLGLIDLIFAVEKRFDIEIPDTLLRKANSLMDLSNAVDAVRSGGFTVEKPVNA